MAKFTRSNISKLNERHFRLHDKEYTVYVEGDIDKSFWEKVFPVVEEWKPRIEVLKTADGEILGGWKNLVNYLEEEIKKQNKIDFIIAIDGDYNEIIKHKPNYKNIVKTKKYSIENYLFCPNSINKYMKILSRETFDNVRYVKTKLEKFALIVKNLIILDCINEKDTLGIKVYDFNAEELSSYRKINNYVNGLTLKYKSIIEQHIHILDNYNILDYIRWKIFIKKLNDIISEEINEAIKQENSQRKNNQIKLIRKIKVDERLYLLCLQNCQSCIGCKDYEDLKIKAKAAFDSLKLVS